VQKKSNQKQTKNTFWEKGAILGEGKSEERKWEGSGAGNSMKTLGMARSGMSPPPHESGQREKTQPAGHEETGKEPAAPMTSPETTPPWG